VIFLKLQSQGGKLVKWMISPNYFGGLLNETLSLSSVNRDGSPAEASVQQYPNAERTAFLSCHVAVTALNPDFIRNSWFFHLVPGGVMIK
jgi:hypothetical protein